MPFTNDFLPFADGIGPNVVTQADYLAAAWRPSGFQSGLAVSGQLNKVWRQSSIMTSAIAQLVSDRLSVDVLDDGNVVALEALLGRALGGSIAGAPIAGAGHTFAQTDQGKAVLRSNGGATMSDVLPGAVAGVLPAGTLLYIYNDDAAAIYGAQVGPGATALDGVANGFVLLGPKQGVMIHSDGANYRSLLRPTRAVLKANTNFYVSVGGAAGNMGILPGAAVAFPSQAAALVLDRVDVNGKQLNILLADGLYADQVTIGRPFVGASGAGNVWFLGNDTLPYDLVKMVLGSSAFVASGGASYTVYGIYMEDAGGNNCMTVGDAGSHIVISHVNFGPAPQFHISLTNWGCVSVADVYRISGSASIHVNISVMGFFDCEGPFNITITGNPNFSSGYIRCHVGGVADIKAAVTFVGTATGPRFEVSELGNLYTQGAGLNFLPGNAPGIGNSLGVGTTPGGGGCYT